jgi:hypothetical protein
MDAFATEATAILNSAGRVVGSDVVAAIADELAKEWNLAPGHAETAAWDALHFFDETGVFVMSGADETVSPRIALFAEIGDALRVISRLDQIPEWIQTRIDRRQLEPLILASSLSSDAAIAVSNALAERPDDIELTRALARAVNEGAALDDDAIRSLCERLIAHVATGVGESWEDWSTLMSLPLPADLRESAESAASRHSAAHLLVARASLDLLFRNHQHLVANPGLLLEVLNLSKLPRTPLANPSLKGYVRVFVDAPLQRHNCRRPKRYLVTHRKPPNSSPDAR